MLFASIEADEGPESPRDQSAAKIHTVIKSFLSVGARRKYGVFNLQLVHELVYRPA